MKQMSIDALRSFSGVGPVDLRSNSTALVLIDMQNDYVRSDGFTVLRLLQRGLRAAAQEYESQLETAIPTLRKFLHRARELGQPVFHVRTVNQRGRQSGGQQRPNQWIDASSEGANIIDELAPIGGETIVTKTCSGVFAGTNIDFLLRRLEITSLVVGGVVTDGCVEQAIRQAHDLGYACALASDGCAALTREIHENALVRLQHRRAHVLDSETLLDMSVIPETEVLLPSLDRTTAQATS